MTPSFSKSLLALFVLNFLAWTPSAAPAGGDARGESTVLEIENRAETLRLGAANWMAAQTNQVLRVRDQFRTYFKSRATLRLSNQGILRVNQLTTLEIQPPDDPDKQEAVLDLQKGAAYFFNRDEVETQFRTPQASGAIRGTEFNIEVGDDGRTVVTLLDGLVDLTNRLGAVSLQSGEQGIVEPGQAPRKTAVIDAVSIIQWGLYYPGVLDVSELGLTEAEQSAFRDSLSAYRAGELLLAVAAYPTNRTAISPAERIYAAALDLAVGQVNDAEATLAGGDYSGGKLAALAGALRQLIAAVKFETWERSAAPQTATGWMAESYYQQSRAAVDPAALEQAREAARKAVEASPSFGFAHARVAEMEFSFGRTEQALAALEKGLELAPRNAQALSLKGFLLAAQNRIEDSFQFFDQAIAIDGGLGNAWLGRGLCKIKLGDSENGRADLQVAATLEPHRGVLRSYLGKAYAQEGDLDRASKEIELAKRYDPNDPTAYLYSALLRQQQNRVNEGIRDLEKSVELNDNRSVFRSQLLLDQDRAVRSANLAKIYQDAGMRDLSVREASRAVNYDYGNYSAHLFLANSYDALRDPRQITLRFETPWLSEYLLANLLAPVGAGTLSQSISQQEYGKLFERDRLGVSSSTDYLSRGDWLQTGSQFGTFGNSSYSLDVNYRSETGERANADLEALTFWGQFKQQLTPKDSLFVQAVYYDFESGDVAQYYNHYGTIPGLPAPSRTRRVRENQEPLVFAGYHHEWDPGIHTLFLAGRLHDDFHLTERGTPYRVLSKNAAGEVTRVDQREGALDFRSELEGFTTELQQIWQQPKDTLVLGARYQAGWQDTASILEGRPSRTEAQTNIETELQRFGIYSYYQRQLLEPLRLTLGVSYDHLDYPQNIDISPLTDRQEDIDQVSPKAGLLWTPTPNTNVRGYYSQSLGGLFFDTSVRIEPVQVAGFTQAYRSLIPESVRGLVAGSEFELWGAAADHRFPTGTYIGVDAQVLNSEASRSFGVYDAAGPFSVVPSSTPEEIDFREKTLLVTVNQLIGRDWSVGANYRLSQAQLNDRFSAIGSGVRTSPPGLELDQDIEAVMNQVDLFAIYTLPCGFFSQFDALFTQQSNHDYSIDLPGDEFWHLNLFMGYRFPRRLAEIRVGILNLTDRDYNLNPLNLHMELPRERTFAARFRFNY